MNALASALESFVGLYHGNARLVNEQKGWTRVISLVSSDSSEASSLRIEDGHVVACVPGQLPEADVVITSTNEILLDILHLRRGPNEPYLFGELTVRGAEADFLRLDYIASVLCPE
jgi:hypothetical protein